MVRFCEVPVLGKDGAIIKKEEGYDKYIQDMIRKGYYLEANQKNVESIVDIIDSKSFSAAYIRHIRLYEKCLVTILKKGEQNYVSVIAYSSYFSSANDTIKAEKEAKFIIDNRKNEDDYLEPLKRIEDKLILGPLQESFDNLIHVVVNQFWNRIYITFDRIIEDYQFYSYPNTNDITIGAIKKIDIKTAIQILREVQ